jgi:hypothetical protein
MPARQSPQRLSPEARLAIDAAEQGLEVIDQRWAILLARRFLDDPDFRAACPREPLRLSRYDWIIFPPPHVISEPFTHPREW